MGDTNCNGFKGVGKRRKNKPVAVQMAVEERQKLGPSWFLKGRSNEAPSASPKTVEFLNSLVKYSIKWLR